MIAVQIIILVISISIAAITYCMYSTSGWSKEYIRWRNNYKKETTTEPIHIVKKGRPVTKDCQLLVKCERCGCEFTCHSSYGEYNIYANGNKYFNFECPECKTYQCASNYQGMVEESK